MYTMRCIFFKLIIFLVMSERYLCANILAVTTLSTRSHHIWNKAYLMELVRKGHNVTLLGHDEEKQQVANFTVIVMEGLYEKLAQYVSLESLGSYTPFDSIKLESDWSVITCEYDLESNGIKALLNYPPDYKFDLIIWDIYCGQCLYPLIDRFGTPPVIATSPFGNPPSFNDIFGGSTSSHIPYFEVTAFDPTSLITRLKSFMYNNISILMRRYYTHPRVFKVSKKYFGDNIRTIDEVDGTISLILSNIDPLFNYPEPLPPNVIPVAGIHVPPLQELPKDLKLLLDEAKNGVIVVAFGTNLNWIKFEPKQKQSLIEAFGRLKQLVLIKSPDVDFPLPKNIVLRKWIPQSDVLAHPNVKLFITHGGALSTQEGIIRGIPIIGIPFFFDQHGNMGRIHARKLGKSLNYMDITADLVYNEIVEILNNPVFYKNTQRFSKIYQNQPQTPLDKAVFWTEHIILYGNAGYLNLSTRSFNIFQRHDIDIIVLLSTVLFMLIYLCCKIFKALKMLFIASSASKQKQQ